MTFRQKPDGGRRAVAWLATCVVSIGGGFACAAIAMAGDAKHFETTLASIGGVLAGMMALFWLMRDRPLESRLWTNWNWLLRRGKRRIAYHLRPKLPPCERAPNPGPPTAESIREISGGTSTWVPISTPPQRPRGPS
jgi:hypothetical protein